MIDQPTSMDATAAAELNRSVDRIDGLRDRWSSTNTSEPQPASLAATDAEIPHARFIRIFASMAMTVAIDHLSTWQLVVRGGLLPIYAPMTLMRGGLEGAVLCRWFVDPRCDPMTRVARGVAAQVDDWDERRKFEVAINAPPPPPDGQAKSGAERLADVIASRDRDGIPELRFADTTTLTTRYGVPGHSDTSWLYRMVSAFAHAKQWALLATTLGPVTPHAMPGVMGGHVTGSDHITLGATQLVVDHVEAALAEYASYMGASSG